MFKTHIDGKEVKVTFQHQKAAHKGQLTRPKRQKTKATIGDILKGAPSSSVVRVPVYAKTFCFFGDLCVGVADCSYSDQKKYSKETGRRVSLKDALKGVLRRSGKKDHEVVRERRQVWEDYFRESTKHSKPHPLVIEQGIRNLVRSKPGDRIHISEFGTFTDIPTPMPIDHDEPMTSIPWRLGGHGAMNDETIAHLNAEDAEEEED